MNFLFFFIILPNVLNQEESVKNFYLYDFYLQYNSSNYIIDLYQNQFTEFLIGQFPLTNKLLLKNENLMSIQLNTGFIIDEIEKKSEFKKGNIISDGNTISLYYKNIDSDLLKDNYILIGNFKEIDKLIEISDNGEIPIYINLITSCKSTIISYKNSIILNDESLSFQLFSRNSNSFNTIPYIFFNDNNYDLSRYCTIENKGYSIFCELNDDLYIKYKGTFLTIIEVVPGCESPIDTGILIEFNYEFCESLNEDGECSKCYPGYYYNKNEKKCKKKKISVFYFLVIGLPIIWFVSILISIGIIVHEDKNKGLLIVLAFFFGPITLIGLIIYFYK